MFRATAWIRLPLNDGSPLDLRKDISGWPARERRSPVPMVSGERRAAMTPSRKGGPDQDR